MPLFYHSTNQLYRPAKAWLGLVAVLYFVGCKKEVVRPSAVFPYARPLVLNDTLLRAPFAPRSLSSAMIPVQPDSNLSVPFAPDFFKAAKHQETYLQRADVDRYPVRGIHKKELLQTVRLLQAGAYEPGALFRYFDYYEINTELKMDRVRITGYYTPTIEASKTQTGERSVPMLKWPKEDGNIPVPSPASIEAGALGGRGLELAWVSSKKELHNAQLQGSCVVQFPDGDTDFLGFGSSVRGDGGAYVFFKKIGKEVLGSGSFPLTAGFSAAIDPRFIPIGGTLLAELPVCDKAGNTIGYEYRIIFAQDRGGAIKTTKRMDLYCGIGKKGLDAAKRVNSYGRLWLLLPKRDIETLRPRK
jgi:membrane-bound lytic murein transglycosylase A